MMSTDHEGLEARLAQLEKRLRHIEDERDIARLIASYGPSVDAADAEGAASLWSADGTYDVEGWLMSGREDIAAMVGSDGHRRLVANGCCHFLGPAVVTVDGDDAVAGCVSLVVLRAADGYPERESGATAHDLPAPGYVVWRAAANHFRLHRIDDRWQIVARRSRLLGNPEAQQLLTAGVAGQAE
ncbi:nuclear transport factor 2 family protein [Mycolicibacterium austroafricanum]|uniref:nuclear transport factor 2 family protein n=1 Tax=Mycolicibacterium austroafricanum TaxID=39687 RepID=UPI003AF3BEBD